MVEKIESEILDDSGNYYNENIKNLPNVDLLPYACYIDDKTIITENGELLQIIKIPSFLGAKGEIDAYSLRDKLTKTFKKYNKNKNLNFWFQTVRKKVDLVPKIQQYKNLFARQVVDKWNKVYDWEHQYANEIYITIIIAPQENTATKIIDFIKAISTTLLKKAKVKELSQMHQILDECVNGFLKDLKEYEPTLLKIVKKNGIYYSEHLKLFNLILNGNRNDVKLPINDLSESIINKKILYDTNSIKVYNNFEESYLAIISVKYCPKLLLSQLDKIIQLNQEMIITQTVSFVDSKPINEQCQDYIDKLSINEDYTILNLSEYAELMNPSNADPHSSILSQFTITVKGGTKKELEKNVKALIKVLRKIGLVAVREEMFMPTLFWSQAPANFNFIKRFQIIPEDSVCSYTSLYNFPIGKLYNNYWGDCLVVLKSALDTPYFLPLHFEKNGNCFIMGPKNVRKTKYLNFLVLTTLKQCAQVYYLDTTNRSNVFINSIGGDYYFITKRDAKLRLKLNPFVMEKNDKNFDFIAKWLKHIVFQVENGMVKMDEESTGLEQEWEVYFKNLKENFNSINNIQEAYNLATKLNLPEIVNSLKQFVNNDKYGMIFNTDDDIFETKTSNIVGLNISSIINNELLKICVIDYVLYRITELAKGERTVLAIDEAWTMLDNQIMGAKFVDIIQNLYSKNISLIISTSGSDSFEHSNIKISMKNLFAMHIILANIKATVYQKKVFTLSEDEAKIISCMQEEKGTFLLKNGKNVLISSFDFSALSKEQLSVLSGGNVITNIMNKTKELINSEDPNMWLPIFFLMLEEYNKKKQEQKMKEQERRQLQWEEAKQEAANNNKILSAD